MRAAFLFAVAVIVFAACVQLRAVADDASQTPAQRGYNFLVNKIYLPPDFDQQTFDEAWKTWPEPLRSKAEQATVEERRQMAYSRYGITPRPDDAGKPLQYVVDEDGVWTMNCFACHGGKVAGRVIPGLPNSHYSLQTLTEEIRETKLRLKKPMGRMDIGSLFMPLSHSNGGTNAVMFGVVLLGYRDADLNLVVGPLAPRLTHHDMDPPPWWHFKKRRQIYIDGFAEKGHRALMQFMLVKENGPKKFREWEDDFRDVYAYLQSLEAPQYPFAIDRGLAAEGEAVFNDSCAHCHGAYGENETYPGRDTPIDEIGTDRVRYDALTAEHRQRYAESWFAHYGEKNTLTKPAGYVAPPLDGVWASAPYFHNGSVPTLWHVLNPSERPAVWLRSEDGYDRQRVGLEVQTFTELPAEADTLARRRESFDTSRFGKSAAGHLFPDELSDDEKLAVLEYLKTL